MLTRREKDQRREFVRLTSSLTKQGFSFEKGHTKKTLVFPRYDFKRLYHPDTKTPFVDATVVAESRKNRVTVTFRQWSDRVFF